MEEKIKQLKTILAEISDLGGASALLGWDKQTYMPPGGAQARGQQMGTLRRLAHQRWTSDEMSRLLEDLKPVVSQLPPDSDDARLVKVTARQRDRRVNVPAEWVVEFAQATAMAHHIWQEAREKDQFSVFQPSLEHIVDLRRQYASFFPASGQLYDQLLEEYEPGLKTADVQAIFDTLRPRQVEIIRAIANRPQVENAFLFQPFDPQKQWDFGVEVITRFGYDWKRGRQDFTAHPFTTGFSVDDVRITTRILPNFLNAGLFGTLHECGHALYDQGISPALERTPLAHGASLAVHESQSRMWENLVGRSYPFWQYFYPRLQETFPAQLANVPLDTFYRGINRVQPSLIRVEADEATYNLHIMLRLSLEIEMIEGQIAVKDLPVAWNTRFQDYLGITPPSDADGVLQDVHWSGGMIGYFSTYALGNLISVQLWECIQKQIPDISERIRGGDFSALLAWLRENIHRHGAKFEPQELVERVTGSKIDPAPYLRYLREKYGAIYGL